MIQEIAPYAGIAVLMVTVIFGYGKLTERVNNLKEDVSEIKEIILKHISKT